MRAIFKLKKLKLYKSSYVITSLQTKVEHFNLMPIISCAVIPVQPSIIEGLDA